MSEQFNNGGRWIKVHSVGDDGVKYLYAINLEQVICIGETDYMCKRQGGNSKIWLMGDVIIYAVETVNEIGAMIQ